MSISPHFVALLLTCIQICEGYYPRFKMQTKGLNALHITPGTLYPNVSNANQCFAKTCCQFMDVIAFTYEADTKTCIIGRFGDELQPYSNKDHISGRLAYCEKEKYWNLGWRGTTHIEKNCLRIRNNIGKFSLSNAAECYQKCLKKEECGAFAFDMDAKVCKLTILHSSTLPYRNDRCVSGYVSRCRAFDPECRNGQFIGCRHEFEKWTMVHEEGMTSLDFSYPSNLIKGVKSTAACYESCKTLGNCVAFDYDIDTKQCYMATEDTNRIQISPGNKPRHVSARLIYCKPGDLAWIMPETRMNCYSFPSFLEKTEEDSAAECFERCKNTSDCVGFSYRTNTTLCTITGSSESRLEFEEPNCVSGTVERCGRECYISPGFSIVTHLSYNDQLKSGLEKNRPNNSIVSVECLKDYELHGNERKVCYKDGTMDDGMIGECKKDHKPTVCKAVLDLVFVMDESGSIFDEDFPKFKRFLTGLIDLFQVGPDSVRIATVKYNETAKLLNTLEEGADASYAKLVIMETMHGKGYTATGRALEMVRDQIIPNARPEAEKVVIVFTDGDSTHGVSPQIPSEHLRKQGVFIYAVGIGHNVHPPELKKIGGDNYKKLEGFESLSERENFAETIKTIACSD